jgi:phage terminase large subunit-like protein
LAFHRCKQKNRWVFGGNRSGKTECGAAGAVWWARGNRPDRENRPGGATGGVGSLSQQVQRDVAQSKILHYLNPEWIEKIVMCTGSRDYAGSGVIDHIVVKNAFGNLSKIGFKSCEAGREKFQGTGLDFVWFDEEPPYDVYRECRMRLLDRGGELWGTMTPLKGLTFAYHEIYLNPRGDDNVWCTFMEWGDNPFLSSSEVENLTKNMSEDELESRRYGRFRSAAGLVYNEFDEGVHVVEPFDVPTGWYDVVSIDPGLKNPLSAHWYAVDGDGTVYVVAEHYLAGQTIAFHADKIKEISARLGWPKDSRGRVRCLIDSAANQRTLASQKSVAELFGEQGLLVDTRVNKDVWSGLSRVKSYLRPLSAPPKLYIFKTCPNLIREFKSYFWGEGDSPRKADDHALAELRYYISSRPESYRPFEQKSAIQRDKERLIKRIRGHTGAKPP